MVTLITVHDGFTLADLVSYDGKHNQANGENNRDGTSDNYSWNCGAEGPTSDPDILALRARQSRALLTTLMLSFGVMRLPARPPGLPPPPLPGRRRGLRTAMVHPRASGPFGIKRSPAVRRTDRGAPW